MSSIALTGGLYFDRLIQVSVSASGSWAELALALPGEANAAMAPVDAELFSVTVNGVDNPVLEVQMHKQASLLLLRPIPKNATVQVTYRAPDGDREQGVLQTASGLDVPTGTVSSPQSLSYFRGFRTQVLSGAEQGIDFSREFPELGVYLDDSGASTIDAGNTATVTRVAGGKMTVQIIANTFAGNPAYSASAPAGSFASYALTKGKLELVLDASGLPYQPGDAFDASLLGEASRNVKAYEGTQYIIAASEGQPEKEFALFSHVMNGDAVPFWLAIGVWQFGRNGVDFNKVIDGGEHADVLLSSGGNDVLTGGGGDDTIYAGDGNDQVAGGDGSDLIIGGAGKGNDSYDGGKGADTVKYTSALAAITVNLTRGSATSTAGNDAAGIGTDRLRGIENLIAGDFADTLIGSKDANAIDAGAGDDTIDGGLGKDTLTGGMGADRFVFSTRAGATNVDTVSDFASGTDKLVLSARVFSKLKGLSDLSAHFAVGAPTDANDFVVFDIASGRFSYDADGNGKGKAVDVAIIGGGIQLQATDFSIS